VTPDSVIKYFDIVEQICFGQVTGFVDPFTNTFFLQATEERLDDGIDAPMSNLKN